MNAQDITKMQKDALRILNAPDPPFPKGAAGSPGVEVSEPIEYEDVANMNAGREMDILIIKAVFGLEPQQCMVGGHPPGCPGNVQYPAYSTDIAAAWQVVQKLKEQYSFFRVESSQAQCFADIVTDKDTPGHYQCVSLAQADTAPLAICRAALMAVAVKPQGAGK